MKNKAYGNAFKSAAFFLFLIFVLAAFWSLLGVAYMAKEGYYDSGYSFYKTELFANETQRYADEVFYNYFPLTTHELTLADDRYRLSQYQTEFTEENTNFLFELSSISGVDLLKNYKDQSYGFKVTFFYSYGADSYFLECYVRNPISAPDNYMRVFNLFNTLYSMRYGAIAAACVSAPIAIALFVYLMYAAGRRKSADGVVMTWQHSIPLDLFTAGLICAGAGAVLLLENLNISIGYEYGFLVLIPASMLLTVFSAFALIFCMNLAVHIKKGKWWRSTVIYLVLSLIGRVSINLFGKLPMLGKASIITAGYLIVNAFLSAVVIGSGGSAAGLILWLLFNVTVFAALCFLLSQMKALKNAGARIKTGDYESRIDTKNMLWDIRQHADNLNNIGAGMSIAVDARMKSERLKTELITNVSHDLKTPLTSIITYVDLLKKEEIASEQAMAYIDVLDRSSIRLKKLMEDLLEASKAATGNTSISLKETNLVELLSQAVGEYTGRFETARLEVVFRSAMETINTCVDGRLLWRVLDNLLDNICKYSLTGTRVYISIDTADERVKLTLMNISSNPLNIPVDELLERFVRGDTSRSSEGSGLGLSIAKSLTELQNGTFELSIEGDLFKTVITFHKLP